MRGRLPAVRVWTRRTLTAVTGFMPRANTMHDETRSYNHAQDPGAREICDLLAREIQWDYKNIVKRKGRLERLR